MPHNLPFIPAPQNEAAAVVFTPSMTAFRFYFRGDEEDSVAAGAENANIGMASNNRPGFQFRARVQETAGVAGDATDDWDLQYKLNAGSWVTVGAGTSVVRISAMAISSGEATAQRLTNGTGSYLAGIAVDSVAQIADFQLTASNYTEFVWGIQLQDFDLAEDDTIEFRILLNGSPIAQTVTPVLTVQDFNWDMDAFRFYEDGTEAGAVAIATENTNIIRNPGTDPDLQLRYRLQASNGVAGSIGVEDDDWRLQVQLNGGAWVTMNSVNYITNNAASALTDGSATTQRLSAGTGSFEAGSQEDSSTSGATSGNAIGADNHTENVNALSLVDANLANNDVIDFRVTRVVVGIPVDTGRSLSVEPRITISK